MGFFDFLKKQKTDVELYYEMRARQEQSVSMSDAGTGFCFAVEDVFTITGRGTVVVGAVETGSVQTGDVLTLQRMDGTTRTVTVVGLELFRKMVSVASAGDHVGMLLRNVKREEVAAGDMLVR